MTEHTTNEAASPAKRRLFALAAVGAAAVTTVFATIGDGVNVAEAEGLRHMVVEHGHTLVWALLTVALALAAWRGRFTRVANAVAVSAGVVYAAFLFSVFLWP